MASSDDRSSNARLYVGHLSSRTTSKHLDCLFSIFGSVLDVDMKRDCAFVHMGDAKDAEAARFHLDGTEFGGSRITVKFARGVPRSPPRSGRCFRCGISGHRAQDCRVERWVIVVLVLALIVLFVCFCFV